MQLSGPKETPFLQIPKGRRDVVSISIPKYMLASRLPQHRKCLVHISGSIGILALFTLNVLQLIGSLHPQLLTLIILLFSEGPLASSLLPDSLPLCLSVFPALPLSKFLSLRFAPAFDPGQVQTADLFSLFFSLCPGLFQTPLAILSL